MKTFDIQSFAVAIGSILASLAAIAACAKFWFDYRKEKLLKPAEFADLKKRVEQLERENDKQQLINQNLKEIHISELNNLKRLIEIVYENKHNK